MTPTNVVITGAAGRMGQALLRLSTTMPEIRVVATLERPGHPWLGRPAAEMIAGVQGVETALTADVEAALRGADVFVDFTMPEATMANLGACARAGVAAVVGTTGLSPAQRAEVSAFAAKQPCVFSTNYSVGVNVLWKALEMVAKVTGEAYDVEIVEAHHHHKKDAPSGTAMTTAEVIAKALGRTPADFVYGRQGIVGERTHREIGIHAVRGGDIVGDHTVYFAGPHERLEFKHQAHSREMFAGGALRAAAWLKGRGPGLYSMGQVLGLD